MAETPDWPRCARCGQVLDTHQRVRVVEQPIMGRAVVHEDCAAQTPAGAERDCPECARVIAEIGGVEGGVVAEQVRAKMYAFDMAMDELRQLRADAARLDWLEAHTFTLDNDAERCGPREMAKLLVGERGSGNAWRTAQTVRAILDDARASSSERGGAPAEPTPEQIESVRAEWLAAADRGHRWPCSEVGGAETCEGAGCRTAMDDLRQLRATPARSATQIAESRHTPLSAPHSTRRDDERTSRADSLRLA